MASLLLLVMRRRSRRPGPVGGRSWWVVPCGEGCQGPYGNGVGGCGRGECWNACGGSGWSREDTRLRWIAMGSWVAEKGRCGVLYGWSSTLIVRTLEEAVSVSWLGSTGSLSIGPVKDEEASRQIGDGSRRKKKRARGDGERERRRTGGAWRGGEGEGRKAAAAGERRRGDRQTEETRNNTRGHVPMRMIRVEEQWSSRSTV